MRALIAPLLVAAAATIATPAELLGAANAPAGFASLGDEYVTQTFDEFAESSPYSVGHVEAGSADVEGFIAGQDVWTLGEDDSLLREVSMWPDPGIATGYIEEIVEYAVGLGMRATDPPFDGALEFTGVDPDTQVDTHIAVWQHGRIGIAVSHFHSGGETPTTLVNEAAQMLADAVTVSTGIDVGDDDKQQTITTTADGAPVPNGGIPIGKVLFWLVVVIAGIWLVVTISRKLRPAQGQSATPRSADEIIDEARSQARTDRPDVVEQSTDDVIAEARRQARDEVDRESDKWQVPDDS
jgi:hypothetical protein